MVLVSAFKTYGFGMDNSSSRADWTKLTQKRPMSMKKTLETGKPDLCKATAKLRALQELLCSTADRHF